MATRGITAGSGTTTAVMLELLDILEECQATRELELYRETARISSKSTRTDPQCGPNVVTLPGVAGVFSTQLVARITNC